MNFKKTLFSLCTTFELMLKFKKHKSFYTENALLNFSLEMIVFFK